MRNRDDPRMMLGLEAAQDALARVQRLVEEFSNFARLPQANLKAADFETLARRSTDPWSQAGPPEVTVSPPRDRVVVTVDGDLFDHVAQNLLKNAREAAGPGGEVEVTIEALDGWGRMTVRNTGEPIPESHLERLFEGGLTTKPTGLGLGLSIAQELTRRMNGRIWAENLPAGGVAFHAEFPSPPGAE
jgi:signal transduction histidine kinase